MIRRNPKPIYVITSWDDADRCTLKLTHLLENYALDATLFVPVKPTNYGKMPKEEIVELSKVYEVGSHGLTHSNLTKLPLQMVKREVSESKHVLEQMIGSSVLCFCYPGGFFNEAVKNEVETAGYLAARTTKPYRIIEGTDPLAMPTTIQARPQTKLSSDIFALANINVGLIPSLLISQKWTELGKKLFDICLKRGGVFHVWGHAWEIERQNGWNALEDFFNYISYRKDVSYLPMGEYAEKCRKTLTESSYGLSSAL